MKTIKDYINESIGAPKLRNKTYTFTEKAEHNSYETTITITNSTVNIKGKPDVESWAHAITSSDFWISTKDFSRLLYQIKHEPEQWFEEELKPAPGNDKKFKKIWFTYQPKGKSGLWSRIYLFQSESGAKRTQPNDPYQWWAITLNLDFQPIFDDNPTLDE